MSQGDNRHTSFADLRDVLGNTINPATKDVQTNGTQKTQVVGAGGSNVDFATSAKQDDIIENQTDGTQIAQMYGKTGDATFQVPRIDATTHTLTDISYEHHEIHGGTHFLLCSYVDLAINNVYDIQITTPNTTTWGHFTFEIEPESATLLEVYENVTISTAGTPENVRNNNRNSATTSVLTINGILNTSTANANSDTAISGATLIENGKIGSGAKSGGSSSRDKELILKQNEDYTIRFTATAAGYVNYCFSWYQHANRTA